MVALLTLVSLVLLITPKTRKSEGVLPLTCGIVFLSLWIDKGFGLIIGGFVPNPFEEVHTYWPTIPESVITVGVWAVGLLILSMLYKIAISVRIETEGIEVTH